MQEITERMVTVIVLQALAIFFLGVIFAPAPLKVAAVVAASVAVLWVERQDTRRDG